MISFIKKHREILIDLISANLIIAYAVGMWIGLHYYPVAAALAGLYPIAVGVLVLIFQSQRYPTD